MTELLNFYYQVKKTIAHVFIYIYICVHIYSFIITISIICGHAPVSYLFIISFIYLYLCFIYILILFFIYIYIYMCIYICIKHQKHILWYTFHWSNPRIHLNTTSQLNSTSPQRNRIFAPAPERRSATPMRRSALRKWLVELNWVDDCDKGGKKHSQPSRVLLLTST